MSTQRQQGRRRTFAIVTGALVGGTLGAVMVGTALRSEPARAVARAPTEDGVDANVDPLRADEPAVVRAAAPASPAKLMPPSGFDEGEVMRLLRSARGNDAAFCVELAREGNRRFPNSADAAERSSILIHALAEQGLASEARREAEDMVSRYPDSGWVREIERFTGAHRHRNVRVDEQGRLRYYDPPPS